MTKWQPHQYQLDALEFAWSRPHAGLFLSPGLGKTSITLALISMLRRTGAVSRVLILAPIRPMYKVWPDEIRKWADFNHLKVTILHGPQKDARLGEVSDIYVLNYEGLKWFEDNDGFRRTGADMLVADELSKLKTSGTQRFKIMRRNLFRFKKRLGLTGSPTPNGYMDLFGQIYMLDRGAALGQYITHFRNQYFLLVGNSGYNYVLRHGAAKEIEERVRPVVMALKAEDHLDMPDLVLNDITIQLPEPARRVYDQLEEDFMAELEDVTIITPSAAAKAIKCRQVINGAVYDSRGDVHVVHPEKANALQDLVDELQGEPLLVFYEFQHDLAQLPPYPCLTGMTGKKLDATIDAFNRGEIPVLTAHPASAGHGLNLQTRCHNVCFYGLTWDYELYTQAIARVWRQGQDDGRVIVHRIMAEDTLDATVAKTLLRKEGTQEGFIQAIKARAAQAA
jgi:SNF2 family DNA or RNA helicase